MNTYQITAIVLIFVGAVCKLMRVTEKLKGETAGIAVSSTLIVLAGISVLPVVLYLGGFFR